MNVVVVGGVIEQNGKFLLVQETKKDVKGKWNLPAGRLEKKETLTEGAKREIFEETGCKVEITGLLKVGSKFIGDDTVISFLFCTKLLEEGDPSNTKEIKNVNWFTYEEIIAMKESLRSKNIILDSIDAYRQNRILNLDIITFQQ